MNKLSFNSISNSAFVVNGAGDAEREDIIASGRMLNYEHARKGHDAISRALGAHNNSSAGMSDKDYKELNERFQREHLMYAAKRVCAMTGQQAPADFDEFKRQGMLWYGNSDMYKVLQSIYTEIITPILPAVYSEAVGIFADVVEVGFGETYHLVVDSNDIPVFQDSSWGASRSVPRNRFYAKDYTLNPKPRTAMITAKWFQLVSNNMDFGRFFSNLAAGMYAKTMGLWNAAMVSAASNTALVPTGLTYTFSNLNWVTLANKLAAVNNTSISNVFGFGGAVALAKVLPTQSTGTTNVNMDAALAELLGADYTRSGYLGEFMSVMLRPLTDAVVPGTQNGNVTTILDQTKIWMMTGNSRKPLTIAYNSDTPITLEMDPTKTADFEIGINLTMSIDSAAVFSSKIGLINIT